MMTMLYVSILTTIVMTGVAIGLVKTYGEYCSFASSIDQTFACLYMFLV